jgi:hypothetical protein
MTTSQIHISHRIRKQKWLEFLNLLNINLQKLLIKLLIRINAAAAYIYIGHV